MENQSYYQNDKLFPEGMWSASREALRVVEEKAGKRFGDPDNPLLVSVRSGAPISMPGMMDTVLNLGLAQATVNGLARLTGDERFAYDAYRRFVQMFGEIVLGVPKERLHHALERVLVIERTLDIGGDKPLAYIDVPHEDNLILEEGGTRPCLWRGPGFCANRCAPSCRRPRPTLCAACFLLVADVDKWRPTVSGRKLISSRLVPTIAANTCWPWAARIPRSLSRGRPLADALLWGVACGAATAARSGTAVGRRADVEALYRQATA